MLLQEDRCNCERGQRGCSGKWRQRPHGTPCPCWLNNIFTCTTTRLYVCIVVRSWCTSRTMCLCTYVTCHHRCTEVTQFSLSVSRWAITVLAVLATSLLLQIGPKSIIWFFFYIHTGFDDFYTTFRNFFAIFFYHRVRGTIEGNNKACIYLSERMKETRLCNPEEFQGERDRRSGTADDGKIKLTSS